MKGLLDIHVPAYFELGNVSEIPHPQQMSKILTIPAAMDVCQRVSSPVSKPFHLPFIQSMPLFGAMALHCMGMRPASSLEI